MTITVRPAEPRDAAFVGWASVAASRSQMPRGWFDIVLQRDEAFVLEFANISRWRKRSRGGTGRYSMWRRWTARSHPRCAASEMTPSTGHCAKRWLRRPTRWASARMSRRNNGRAVRLSCPRSRANPTPGRSRMSVPSPSSADRVQNQALLAKEIELARAAGFKRAQISIFIGNSAPKKPI